MKLLISLLWITGGLIALAAIAVIGFWLRPVSCFMGLMYAQEYFAGVESHTVMVDGYHVHYLAEGPASGPVVVLVHGLGGRAEDWLKLAPWLTKAGFRLYMPDLPGYGRSEKPANFSYSVPDETAIVVGFMDALGLKQVDLGGWSMGGWIAQRIGVEHPERIRRLMLFDSAGIFEKPTWDTRLFTPTTPEELDQLVALVSPHPQKIPGFIARDILRVGNENAWIIHRAFERALTGADRTDGIVGQLKMPVLIVWGAEDHVTPLRQGEKIHELVPQSKLVVYPGCGHLAAGECAAQMGPTVLEFEKQ